MRKLGVILALLALVPFALSACGGDDDEPEAPETPAEEPAEEPAGENGGGDGGGSTLEVSADPGGALEFEQESLEAEAGEATVEFTNESATEHDVVIEDDAGEEIAATDVITGGSDSTTANLEPGDYTFFCSVSGHREAGMEGPLTVE